MIYLFIVTHIGSGASLICDALDRYPYAERLPSRQSYSHPIELRTESSARILYDKLVFNHELASSSFYNICKFIYVVREPLATLHYLQTKGYSEKGAFNYYFFRLRRLYEMSKKTPNSLLLTWDDITSDKIQKFLNLKTPLYFAEKDSSASITCYEAKVRYEKYLQKLQLNIA